jgi:8-oxo-dGTP diphosphatase
VRKDKKDTPIPDKLYHYLRDDVHNMFIIHNRWMEIPLMGHNLTDSEVHELLTSIIRTVDKFITAQQNRNGYKKEYSVLKGYCTELRNTMSRVEGSRGFAEFTLPDFPAVNLRHPEYERIRKKHNYLGGLKMVDADSGAYRLKREMFKPRGALAVVRHEGRLLMIRRSDSVKRAAGFWGLPGGEVEAGETPEQCAVRELGEEVNLVGEAVNVLGTSTSFNSEFELVWVEIEVNDVSTLRPDTREVAIIRWVEPGAVAELDPLIPGALDGFAEFLGPGWA